MQKVFKETKRQATKPRLSIKTVGEIKFVVQNAQVLSASRYEMIVKRSRYLREVYFVSNPFDFQLFIACHFLSYRQTLEINIWSNKIV